MGLYDFFTVLSGKGGSEVGNEMKSDGGGVTGGGGKEVEVEVEAIWPIDRSVGL